MSTPQLLIKVHDEELGLLGYLAINSFIKNKAYGGIRVRISAKPDDSYSEEASHLAKEMSLKFGFHEIPMGGAKSVILLPPNLDQAQRDRYFKAFGKQIAPLLRRNLIQAGLDMGMTARDLHLLGQGIGTIALDAIPPKTQKSDSGRLTALGLTATFETVKKFYAPIKPLRTYAMEGFGSVGTHLAQYLSPKGMTMVAVSTLSGGLYNADGLDVVKLIELQKEYGDDFIHHYPQSLKITKEELFQQKANVLFLCGGLFSINAANVHQLSCSLIIAGSNCAMDDDCSNILHQRDIHYIPGFVANAGSVLRNHLAKQERITDTELMDKRIKEIISNRVANLMEKALRNNLPVSQQAADIVRDNVQKMNLQKSKSLRVKIITLLRKVAQ